MSVLTPAALEEVTRDVIAKQAELLGKPSDASLDDIRTMSLQTAADHLGIPVERAARELEVIILGPRSRRVTFKAYKAYCEARTTKPKSAAK